MGFLDGGISAAGSLVGGMIQNIFNRKAATTQFHRQKALMDYQNNINQQNELTSASRQMSGMKAAGMNAAASLGQGAPQNATVSAGSAEQAQAAPIGEAISSAFDAQQKILNQKAIEKQDADIEKVKAETSAIKQQTDFDSEFTPREREQKLKNLEQDLKKAFQDTEGQRLSNISTRNFADISERFYRLQMDKMQNDSDLSYLQGEKVIQETKTMKKEFDWIDRLHTAEIQEIASRIGLNTAQAAQASATAATLREELPFVKDMQQAQLSKLNKEICVLVQKRSNMKTEQQKTAYERDIQRIASLYADKEHQRALAEAMSRIINNYARSVHEITGAGKDVSSEVRGWLMPWN